MFSPVVALHCGVGIYDETSLKANRQLMKGVLKEAKSMLKLKANALHVCVKICSLLEDSPITNAGIGSNLNNQGMVECDATIMTNNPLLFGSVGALPGFKNPISVAKCLLDSQINNVESVTNNLTSNALTPPCFLVGPNAAEWCLKNNFKPTKDLITKDSIDLYHQALRSLNKEAVSEMSTAPRVDAKNNNYHDLSTIGAVVLDHNGLVCSATSSGGILLKEPGRCGSSAVHGAGCWAEPFAENDDYRLGVTASGSGEFLIRKQFSSSLSRELVYQTRKGVENDQWEPLAPSFAKSMESLCNANYGISSCVGCVCVRGYQNCESEVCWATNQYSLGVGLVGLEQDYFINFSCPEVQTTLFRNKLSVTSVVIPPTK